MKFPRLGLTPPKNRERLLGCSNQASSSHPLHPRNFLREGGHPLEPPAGTPGFLHFPVPQQQRMLS